MIPMPDDVFRSVTIFTAMVQWHMNTTLGCDAFLTFLNLI